MPAFVAQGSNVLHMFIRQHHYYRRTFSSSCLRQSHYETLGVPRTATSGQIKTSFYRLSQQYHPDINKGPDAREKFQKVSEAWAVLKDGRQKREYDNCLRREGSASSSASTQYSSGSYYDPPEWSSHSRRHTRQSAEWAWSYSYRTSAAPSGDHIEPTTRSQIHTSSVRQAKHTQITRHRPGIQILVHTMNLLDGAGGNQLRLRVLKNSMLEKQRRTSRLDCGTRCRLLE
ncbi:hypothetical protein PILCRDRAFT_651790 [Piloderma croceum F 1598]|uniref:J domain-containing protein n=1 Tax=Piloderma croceum (strain F 1598) TaxID=765440 RepID=A0A0C3F8Y9_PILCF|nr:hypothetical protein PILCRDRAFT_651790 [Piloderma croceum F 1598]